MFIKLSCGMILIYVQLSSQITSSKIIPWPYTVIMKHSDEYKAALLSFLDTHPRIFVLTGAGISAPSGLPTYRDRQGNWLYRRPIQQNEYLQQETTRKRYWARSMLGWPAVRDAAPNEAHEILADLELQERVELVVTQNVDRLHQRAGSSRVIDLHGRLDRVRCLTCGDLSERESLQQQLETDNPAIRGSGAEPRPDGDFELSALQLKNFRLPHCRKCSGTLKPDVVFFGGSVPKGRVDSCISALQQADALLAIGTSLQVYSGFRFCRMAAEQKKAIAIINPGDTRADKLATLKVSLPATSALQGLAR
jgi:NAD-dependent SIR2 family protein deacetylase